MFNRLRFAADRAMRMSNVTERLAAAYGGRTALIVDAPPTWLGLQGTAIGFDELHRAVSRLATVLRRSGLQRFGRVAVYKTNHIDYYVMCLAVMRAGGIAVPVHGDLPTASFVQYAAYTGCEAVYTDDEHFARIDRSQLPGVHTWLVPVATPGVAGRRVALEQQLSQQMPAQTPLAEPAALCRHDDALIVHTSGTTGFPKGVLHSSESLIHSVRIALLRNPLPSDDRVLIAGHLNHHIAFTSLLAANMCGTPASVATDLGAAHLLDRMEREKTTLFFAFPDVYLRLYAGGLVQRELPSMRYWLTGGDAMHEVHIRECVRKGRSLKILGWSLRGSLFIELLGTSEVGSAALTKISSLRTKRFSRYVGRQSWIGPRVKVADASGRPMPAGVPGRLMVRGRTLFKGYWNLHERLHEVMVDGWWWTGDMAMQDRRGRIYHLDREADMVHSGSGPVFGLPIEEKLLMCKDIGEAAVIEIEHPTSGKVPVALVHSLSGAPVDGAHTLETVNRTLEPGQRLQTVVDVGSAARMPRGLTGKVLKRELRERYRGLFQAGQAPTA